MFGSLGNSDFFFPSNLNVSLDLVSGNIEILGKQNSLFPSGPVIKCLFLLFENDYPKERKFVSSCPPFLRPSFD